MDNKIKNTIKEICLKNLRLLRVKLCIDSLGLGNIIAVRIAKKAIQKIGIKINGIDDTRLGKSSNEIFHE
jgi:hypothetical protein